MGSPVETYQTEMHNNLGFYATWLPADPMEVGDVGVWEGGRFHRVGTLSELNVECKVETTGSMSDVQFTSKQGVQMKASGAGGAIGVGKYNIGVDFSGTGSFVFHAAGLQQHRLVNRMAVGAALLKLYEKKKGWKKEWMLVESVHSAQRATVLVCEDKSAKVVVSASLATPGAALFLADPKAQFSLTVTDGKLFHWMGQDNLRPLYSCLKINDPLFGRPDLVPVRGAAAASAEIFERPRIEELLRS